MFVFASVCVGRGASCLACMLVSSEQAQYIAIRGSRDRNVGGACVAVANGTLASGSGIDLGCEL